MTSIKKTRTLLCLLSAAILSSCVNRIGENEIQVGNIPIAFAAKSGKSTTKTTREVFSNGDKIGVFAMLSGNTLDGQRYINNLQLEAGDGGSLIPKKEVFYPEGDATLDFISYYPYQANGVTAGSSLLNVEVKTDQSMLQDYEQSDFMTARTEDVDNSVETVTLAYGHKLAKIKVVLVPQGKENVDDMLKSDPKLVATGFKTQAVYNLQTNSLYKVTEESETDIIPYGKWTKGDDGTLCGKEFIVIPQTHADSEQSFTLEWNGKIYTCSGISEPIKEDTELEVRINALQSTSKSLTGVIASIQAWGNSDTGTGENKYNITTIHTASLAFETSDVYRIYHQGKAVAEICQEYLICNSGNVIEEQAIVAYPVQDNELTDLTQGTVLQLTNKKEELVHGGTVSWDTENNTLTYTTGNSKPIEKFYIDGNGHIALEKPSDALAINVSSYTIRDIRKGILRNYPIVKVGAQYWMKEDLQTSLYNDNQSIPLKTQLEAGEGYFEWAEEGFCLYNGEAVLTGKLAPTDWKLPNENDWNKLINYVNGNASILKKTDAWYTDRFPATNETGLSIPANGLFLERDGGVSKLVNPTMSNAYWVYDDTENKLEKVVLFMYTNNDIEFKTTTKPDNKEYYNGFSIRCIKE